MKGYQSNCIQRLIFFVCNQNAELWHSTHKGSNDIHIIDAEAKTNIKHAIKILRPPLRVLKLQPHYESRIIQILEMIAILSKH